MIISDKERQAPTSVEEAEPSHLARYQFALKCISSDDKVLDAPCGSGYGSKLLASKNAQIYGVDIHKGAIEHAKEFFSDDLVSFYVGDIENLKNLFLQNDYFDVVVSFEGIEHIKHPELFLDETIRLLKPNGKFIVSTPRKPHGSPYHITEYSLEEFKNLLSSRFIIKQMFGQIYTDIFDLSERNEDPFAYNGFNFIAYCLPK